MKSIKITDSELIIMRILWDQAPVSSARIVKLLDDTKWNPKTIHTFLRRLVAKNIVRAECKGSFYEYAPVLSKEEYTAQETRNFLGKLFDGSLSDLVSTFVKHDTLSEVEIKKLQDMLDESIKEAL